jgi:hypothetical protein
MSPLNPKITISIYVELFLPLFIEPTIFGCFLNSIEIQGIVVHSILRNKKQIEIIFEIDVDLTFLSSFPPGISLYSAVFVELNNLYDSHSFSEMQCRHLFKFSTQLFPYFDRLDPKLISDAINSLSISIKFSQSELNSFLNFLLQLLTQNISEIILISVLKSLLKFVNFLPKSIVICQLMVFISSIQT